jgi:hypothetical protein
VPLEPLGDDRSLVWAQDVTGVLTMREEDLGLAGEGKKIPSDLIVA